MFGIEKRGGRIEFSCDTCSLLYSFPLQKGPGTGTYFQLGEPWSGSAGGRMNHTHHHLRLVRSTLWVGWVLIKSVGDMMLSQLKQWMAEYGNKTKSWQAETMGQVWKDYKSWKHRLERKNLRARMGIDYGTLVTLRKDLGTLLDNKHSMNWY